MAPGLRYGFALAPDRLSSAQVSPQERKKKAFGTIARAAPARMSYQPHAAAG
jgi:hypothetical protein